MSPLTMTPIAHIRTDFPTRFGIPRQPGLVEGLEGRVVFAPPFRSPEALRGMEDFSHLWLVWAFSALSSEGWSPTVRPPRLGGNRRMGVFATRSPFRPNPIGLSCVQLLRIEPSPEGHILVVAGADLMDGTPILDIKPYLPYTDCHPEATQGFTAAGQDYLLEVDIPAPLLERVPSEKRLPLRGILAQDPRPAYQRDGRSYGLSFAGLEISFRVEGTCLHVTHITTETAAHL